MIYKVKARFKEDSAHEYCRKLLDGTEWVVSMNRGVVKESGEIEWSEQCYCNTPLAHERQTVIDHYFYGISTEVIDGYQEYEGRPFMDYLNELAGRSQ